MRICILDCDQLAPELAANYHSYGRMFSRLFSRIPPFPKRDVFVVRHGEYPGKGDDFCRYDAYLLTGSQSDAFSDEQWVVDLRGYVRELLDQKKRLVGICFGHQLIAHVLGAEVGRAEQGWGVGASDYQLDTRPDWIPEPMKPTCLLASHRDQVKTLPAGATRLISSAFCPNAGFFIGNQVLCIQPHPEFSKDYARDLLNFRRKRLGEETYQKGMQSLAKPVQGDLAAAWICAFIGSANPVC
jgi:GMP synthase (glutamine-hydrolysing)